MNGDIKVPSSAPLRPTPKRPNAVLRLFDSPLVRDWAFWLTAGWASLGALAIGTSKDHNGVPAWLDTILATMFFSAVFGLLPAWIRLMVRRRRSRRPVESPTATMPPVAPHSWPKRETPPSPSLETAPSAPQAFTDANYPHPIPHSSNPGFVTLRKDRYEETTSALADTRGSLPHPIARAARTFQLANAPRGQYEALLDAAEILAVVVSTTAASLLLLGDTAQDGGRQGSVRRAPPLLGHPVTTTSGATFGTWTTWLEKLKKVSDTHPSPIPGLQEAFNGTQGGQGLLTHLNFLRDERNRSAHGDKPKTPEEAVIRVRDSAPHLEAALSDAAFLRDLPWLLIDGFDYKAQSNDFSVVARLAMGDHPDFESRPYTWSVPVSRHGFYVLSPRGPVSMSGLVASLYCSQCKQPELCYSYKVEKKDDTVHWKSFSQGHEIWNGDLGSEATAVRSK